LTLKHEFKTAMSRNAVIGKCHRLKLPARRAARPRNKPYTPRKPKAWNMRKPTMPDKSDFRIALPPAAKPVRAKPRTTGHLTILEVKDGLCRYPYGDWAPFMFCGEPVDGGSYCSAHTDACTNYTIRLRGRK
jgi:hypothetical protein